MTAFAAELETMDACADAVKWVGRRSLKTAWAKCERADWLLWYAARRDVDRRLLVRATCACARTTLHLVPDDEHRPRIAIETAEAWCEGKATIKQVRAAACAAACATANACAAAAYTAACATADACAAAAYTAAYANACANACAAYAADTAACANAGADDDVRRQIADLVRGIIRLEDLK